MAGDTEGAIDELFQLPPGEFVASRDALARQLKAGGDREAAARVKALRRPTLVAWALDQLAHRHPEEVDALLDRASEVGQAQAAALAGERVDLGAASDRLQQAISDLSRRAVAVLAEVGGASTHRDEIAAALRAATLDAPLAEQLRAGRLQATPEPAAGGFDALLAAVPGPAGQPDDEPAPDPRAGELAAARRRLEQAVERAETAVHQLERRRTTVAELEARVVDERRQLEADEERAERADETRRAAEEEVARLERELA